MNDNNYDIVFAGHTYTWFWPGTRREIAYLDVPAKREIAASVDVLKLEAQEAEVLTGQTDTAAALAELSGWGCLEREGPFAGTRDDVLARMREQGVSGVVTLG